MLLHLENEDFNEEVKEGVVLVDFFATWCGPCKMMGPVLEDLASNRDSIKVAKVDVDKFESLARTYGVMSIPTLVLFKNGQAVATKVGFTALPLLNEWIDSNR